jgi:hypothetical protein
MSTIVTRVGKGSALTHAEVDANFTNLNNASQTVFVSAGATLTNQPVALSDFSAAGSSWFPLTTLDRYNRARLNCYVATASASVNTPRLFIQYSVDAATWVTVGSGTGSDAVSLSSTGWILTNWITLPAGAVGTNIYFRVAMEGGNAAADPVVRGLSMSFEWA